MDLSSDWVELRSCYLFWHSYTHLFSTGLRKFSSCSSTERLWLCTGLISCSWKLPALPEMDIGLYLKQQTTTLKIIRIRQNISHSMARWSKKVERTLKGQRKILLHILILGLIEWSEVNHLFQSAQSIA